MKSHTLTPASTSGLSDSSSLTTIETAGGRKLWPGCIVSFDQFPDVEYRLQALHESNNPEVCFADFHHLDEVNIEDVHVIGFSMGWRKLAAVIDAGEARVVISPR